MISSQLTALAQQLEQGSSAAIESWQPDYSGELEMRIDRQGQWYYQGGLIKRPALVKVFSDILRLENNQYFLVTPVEKFLIEVEDLPFITQQLTVSVDPDTQQQQIKLTLNQGTELIIGDQHPLVLHPDSVNTASLPAVYVQRGLLARLHRNHYYQLMEYLESDSTGELYGVKSSGNFYPLSTELA